MVEIEDGHAVTFKQGKKLQNGYEALFFTRL